MSGKCKFNKEWLSNYAWLEEVSERPDKGYCKLCNSTITIGSKGIAAVTQHRDSRTHQGNENAAANTVSIDRLLQSKISYLIGFSLYLTNVFLK